MIYIKKIILFLCLFFAFNTLEINSNEYKSLFYDKENLFEEGYYHIYFNSLNSNKLNNILLNSNITVLSYIVDDKKYYADDINELVEKYIKDKSLEEKIYYLDRGIYIDGINIICDKNELIDLENIVHVY